MISCRIKIVGLQLILLAYTAQSFVLLTANIDDIKKLARKFVSESLADQLTDFVVKATEQITEQMQETSGKNGLKSQDISASNEYEISNIARQRDEREERTTKRDGQDYKTKSTRNEETQKPDYLSNESKELSFERDDRLLDNEKNWQNSSKESMERTENHEKSKPKNWRDKFDNSKESDPISTKPKNSWSIEKNEMANNDVFPQERPKNNNYINQDDKKKEHYSSKQSQSFYKESQQNLKEINKDSRLTTPHSFIPTFKPQKPQKTGPKLDERISDSIESPSAGSRYKKIKDRDSKTLTFDFKPPKSQNELKKYDERKSSAETNLKKQYSKDRDSKLDRSIESNNPDGDKLWDFETTRFRGSFDPADDGITTKKERTDFDQYDNRNYPKADFIATSGQMLLPRISPTLNNNKQPKPDTNSWWEKEIKLPNAAQLKSWLATI